MMIQCITIKIEVIFANKETIYTEVLANTLMGFLLVLKSHISLLGDICVT